MHPSLMLLPTLLCSRRQRGVCGVQVARAYFVPAAFCHELESCKENAVSRASVSFNNQLSMLECQRCHSMAAWAFALISSAWKSCVRLQILSA